MVVAKADRLTCSLAFLSRLLEAGVECACRQSSGQQALSCCGRWPPSQNSKPSRFPPHQGSPCQGAWQEAERQSWRQAEPRPLRRPAAPYARRRLQSGTMPIARITTMGAPHARRLVWRSETAADRTARSLECLQARFPESSTLPRIMNATRGTARNVGQAQPPVRGQIALGKPARTRLRRPGAPSMRCCRACLAEFLRFPGNGIWPPETRRQNGGVSSLASVLFGMGHVCGMTDHEFGFNGPHQAAAQRPSRTARITKMRDCVVELVGLEPATRLLMYAVRVRPARRNGAPRPIWGSLPKRRFRSRVAYYLRVWRAFATKSDSVSVNS